MGIYEIWRPVGIGIDIKKMHGDLETIRDGDACKWRPVGMRIRMIHENGDQ